MNTTAFTVGVYLNEFIIQVLKAIYLKEASSIVFFFFLRMTILHFCYVKCLCLSVNIQI